MTTPIRIQTKPVPTCPRCGGQMVLRRPRPKAVKQFVPFWGCSNFSNLNCKGTRNIQEDGWPEEDWEMDTSPNDWGQHDDWGDRDPD